jgi:hypothetical protein
MDFLTTSEQKIENDSFFLLLQTKEKYFVDKKYSFIDEISTDYLSTRYLKDVKTFMIHDIPEYLCFLDKNVNKKTWLEIKEFLYKKKPLDENKYFEDYPFTMLLFSTTPNEKRINSLAYEYN